MLTRKPALNRLLGRLRRRFEDDLKTILKNLVSVRGILLIRLRIGLLESSCECSMNEGDLQKA